MRSLLVVLLALFCFLSVGAQSKKYYYNAHSIACDADSARFYATFETIPGGYTVNKFSVKNKLLMKGTYSSIDSDFNKGREGAFVFYLPSGNKHSEGSYIRGKKNGRWKNYYSANGLLKNEETYLDDSLSGPYIGYDSETGSKSIEGQYVKGKMEGVWPCYHNGLRWEDRIFSNSHLVGKIVYKADGKVFKKLNYADDILISAQQWDDKGIEIPYVPHFEDSFLTYRFVKQNATPTFDLNAYLTANIVYPKKAKVQHLEGRVIVKFRIDEEGNIEKVSVIQSVSPELDAEALRVVSNMPKWNPGKQNEKPVKMFFTLPVAFELH
jgi:TonB family protein